jgi:predicted DNA-binding protein with PD1-like motif
MLSIEAAISQVHLVRLNPGDDIWEMLTQFVRDNGIRDGVILGGIGSLSKYGVHVVKTTNLPPGDVNFAGEGPFDILSITGLILEGRVHAHICFSDTQKAMGGHLELGCRVLTFCVITIGATRGADFTGWDKVGEV